MCNGLLVCGQTIAENDQQLRRSRSGTLDDYEPKTVSRAGSLSRRLAMFWAPQV